MTDNEQQAGESAALEADKGTNDAQSASENAKASKVAEHKRPKVGLLWFFVLLTLLASAAAGYGVYYLWQQSGQSAAQQANKFEQSETAIIGLRDDLNSLEDSVGDQQAQQSAKSAEVAEQFALLEKSLQKQNRHIKELSASNRDQWLLAEVEYLLRLANQRILMSKDSSGALAMLDSADRILKEIDDVSLHAVRRAIADDMASLRHLEQVDVDGIYLKLAALADQSESLDLYEIPEFSTPESELELSSAELKPWKERLQDAWVAVRNAFSKAFIIRHDREQVEAMLPPQEELYLRQNLRLMLEQAQLALLSRQPGIYQSSLEKAQRWIAQYFLIDSDATQAALESLSGLAAVQVDPPLPDISGSFRALKKYQRDQENSRPGLQYQPEPEPQEESSSDQAPEQVVPAEQNSTEAPEAA